MFKKTLVALAISSVSVGAFAAADINTNTVTRTVSQQGAVNASAIQSDVISVTLNAEYAVGDILTFTFAGADVDVTTAPASLSATLVDANDNMTLGLLDSTATTLTYRVTELNYDSLATDTTIGATVAIAADTLEFDTADVLASGLVTVSYAARTSTNFNLDTPTAALGTADVLETEGQFSASVTTAFSETIDVEQDRLAFASGVLATTDAVVITPVAEAGLAYPAIATSTVYTVKGDWSILDSDDTTAGVQVQAGAVTIAGGGVLTSIDANEMVITHTSATVAAQTITVDVESDIGGTLAGAFNPLAQQEFTADVEVNYTDHGTSAADGTVTAAAAGTLAVAANADAGEWDLNGSSFTIPYMAFGPNTKPIFSVTNTGTDSGEIFVEYMAEGSTSWTSVDMMGMEIAPGVTNLKVAVMDAIAADILADTGAVKGKVALRVTINAPEAAISGYAAFKVTNANGESRVHVGTYGKLGTVKN
jgi:hypothetical protein